MIIFLNTYWRCFLAIVKLPTPRRVFFLCFFTVSAPMLFGLPHVASTLVDATFSLASNKPYLDKEHPIWTALLLLLACISTVAIGIFNGVIAATICTTGEDTISVYKMRRKILSSEVPKVVYSSGK